MQYLNNMPHAFATTFSVPHCIVVFEPVHSLLLDRTKDQELNLKCTPLPAVLHHP